MQSDDLMRAALRAAPRATPAQVSAAVDPTPEQAVVLDTRVRQKKTTRWLMWGAIAATSALGAVGIIVLWPRRR